MTLYVGVDLHPHQQTLCWCDSETGETDTADLLHDIEKVRKFYALIGKPAVIGIEASSRAAWFENMIEALRVLKGSALSRMLRATPHIHPRQ
jgi:hypothetical protein